MNLNFQEHIPADFNDDSRVWIYQSSRLFSGSDASEIEELLNKFVASWKSHGAPVKGFAKLFFGQFIVLMADETEATVGGCSTDSSVHVIKAIEQAFQVQMFDRQSLAFVTDDNIRLLPLHGFEDAVENNLVHADSLYFNNTVLTKKEMLEKWLIPVKESWLSKRLAITK